MSARVRRLMRHPATIIVALLLVINGVRVLRSAVAPEMRPPVEHTSRSAGGRFVDVSPAWSHDGRRIAFLRLTGASTAQVCVAPASLARVVRLFGPEVISPDRPLRMGRLGWAAPERIVWSPNDDSIAFQRAEWFHFREGYSLPGAAIWTYSFRSARVAPLVLHPARYRGSLFLYRSPSWRSDGKGVAVVGEGLLGPTALLVRAGGGVPHDDAAVRFDRYLETDWPAWHPRLGRLAFTQGIRRALTAGRIETVRVVEPGGLVARSVLSVDAETYARLCADDVARHPGVSVQPRVAGLCWSRDGRRLVYALSPDGSDPVRSSLWSIEVERASPAEPVRLSPVGDFGYAAPALTPQGTTLAVRIHPQGLDAVEISTDGNVQPRCRLATNDFDWSPDGSAVATSLPEPCVDPAQPCLRVSRWSR